METQTQNPPRIPTNSSPRSRRPAAPGVISFRTTARRWLWVKKLKCTLAQGLRLCTGRTACRGSRGMVLLFLDHGTRSVTPRPLFTPGKDTVPIVQEAGWAPGPVWTCAENLVPTGIRSPDRPARSQSLYRLSYPAHVIGCR